MTAETDRAGEMSWLVVEVLEQSPCLCCTLVPNSRTQSASLASKLHETTTPFGHHHDFKKRSTAAPERYSGSELGVEEAVETCTSRLGDRESTSLARLTG